MNFTTSQKPNISSINSSKHFKHRRHHPQEFPEKGWVGLVVTFEQKVVNDFPISLVSWHDTVYLDLQIEEVQYNRDQRRSLETHPQDEEVEEVYQLDVGFCALEGVLVSSE